MRALDRCDLRHALRFKPGEEVNCRARTGALRVRVSDLHVRNSKKAVIRLLDTGDDKGRDAIGDDGRELVHAGAAGFPTSETYPELIVRFGAAPVARESDTRLPLPP